MNWLRRVIGLDLTGKEGEIGPTQLSPARAIGMDPGRAGGGMVTTHSQFMKAVKIDLRDPAKLNHLITELTNYTPPNQRGNPLADKENKKLHGLHLDDYQPRSHEHGVQRVTFERSYPEPPEWTAEDMYMRHPPSTRWVDYRNRSPVLDNRDWSLPPMRDALADLIEHLHMVHTKLAEHGLVAVEVSVEHEPTPSNPDGVGQGWNFAVHAVAVPQAVLDEERRRFEEHKGGEVGPGPL